MFVEAAKEDVPEIIALRHQIWGTTYRGIYPDDMIDNFDWAWHQEKELLRINDPASRASSKRSGSSSALKRGWSSAGARSAASASLSIFRRKTRGCLFRRTGIFILIACGSPAL